MSENLYKKVIEKLVKTEEFMPLYELKRKGGEELLRLFGVEPNPFKRLLCGKGKSRLYTKEEMAQILLQNGLVESMEEGLREVEVLLEKGIGYFHFFPYINKKGEIKYRLEF